MKVGHILYKANNLIDTVNSFRKQGFKVEYGSFKKPHNALIYFSEGPYIEILEKAPVSNISMLVLRLIGQGKVANRFMKWKHVQEGFFGLCLENYETNFNREELILRKYNLSFFKTKSSRIDPSKRRLTWKLLFPYELKLPFLMTYFNIDPKPVNFLHPNGIKKIDQISFGTTKGLIPICAELCDDDILALHIGNGISHISYQREHHL